MAGEYVVKQCHSVFTLVLNCNVDRAARAAMPRFCHMFSHPDPPPIFLSYNNLWESEVGVILLQLREARPRRPSYIAVGGEKYNISC